MENLTKQQITLLCLLIALFTSIATSVITVSLADSTNQGITNTIYKVVEKSIQEVVPKDSPVQKVIVEKNKTSETKVLSISDIAENANRSLVSIWQKDATGTNVFIASGVVIESNNDVLVLQGELIAPSVKYIVKLSNGNFVEMLRRDVVLPNQIALLSYAVASKDNQKLSGLSLFSFADLKLGSNVIAVGSNKEGNIVSTGIVKGFSAGVDGKDGERNYTLTDINLSDSSSGWVLLDTLGRFVGIISAKGEGDLGTRYLDVNKIKSIIFSKK